jgi:3-oxoacyl-[acyl-carrier-protein] synthase-1
MPEAPIAIQSTGLVTSIGLTTAATCAALRASVTNPTRTRFMGVDGEWIMAHQIPVDEPATGVSRLVRMASLAIGECLESSGLGAFEDIPLLLCVAESDRPGRLGGLDRQLFTDLQNVLRLNFHTQHSAVLAMGRPSALLALAQGRKLIHDHGLPHVLIAATDSLLVWEPLTAYGDHGRLLATHNSNGFIPGEAAVALLLGRPKGEPGELLCLGVGSAAEPAPLRSGEPLRADGLTAAITHALMESGCELHDLDFRITDISGEQYFFKEASLALARSLRKPRNEFDLWHPAEGIGETGAGAGPAMIATALTACRKGYARGPRVLLHGSADATVRVAAVVSWSGARR